MKLARVPRRPDHWSSPHERARVRAAERMDAPLEPAEAAWLDEHLAGCADCRSVADAYAADQDALRGLRATAPEPPRDLWARTAAGIEQEAARRGRPLTASGAGRGFRIPVGMLGGITVVAVVLGATAMSGGWLSGPSIQGAVPTTATRPSQGTVAAAATPMNVDAGDVGWVATTGDGTLAYHAAVNQVCPAGDQPDCPTVSENPSHLLDLATAPKTIINAPDQQRAIVFGSDPQGGDKVLVTTQLARPTPTPKPTPTATAKPTSTPTATPTAPAASPTTTPSSDASATPGDDRQHRRGEPESERRPPRRLRRPRRRSSRPSRPRHRRRSLRSRRSRRASRSPAASRSSARPRRSRPMATGSPSARGRRTARPARTSTCGGSAMTRPGP